MRSIESLILELAKKQKYKFPKSELAEESYFKIACWLEQNNAAIDSDISDENWAHLQDFIERYRTNTAPIFFQIEDENDRKAQKSFMESLKDLK